MQLDEFQESLQRLGETLPTPAGDALDRVVVRARRHTRRRRAALAVAVAVVCAAIGVPVGLIASTRTPELLQVGPAGSGPAGRGRDLMVSPKQSLFDQPVDIRLSHLHPGQLVTVHLSSTDSKGDLWSSQASFRIDRSGVLDVNHDAAVGGSYRGVVPMGLIETMKPASKDKADLLYYWSKSSPRAFRVSVDAGGKTVAATSFSRAGSAPGVKVQAETLAGTGFVGEYWTPPAGTPRHPAVLVIGDSGIRSSEPAGLAAAGYPTLAIAYYGEPGLPSKLKDTPLSYFANALTWLSRQPQVEPGKTSVLGESLGTEAALLLAAHYPHLVHGVIALSPSDLVLNFGNGSGKAPDPWTFDGKPIPLDTRIRVQKIKAPVFVACGDSDSVYGACDYGQDIQRRLSAAQDPYAHVLYEYEGAGDVIDAPTFGYEPVSAAYDTKYRSLEGVSTESDDLARANLWPHLLDFLASPGSQSGTVTVNATGPSS